LYKREIISHKLLLVISIFYWPYSYFFFIYSYFFGLK